MEPKFCKGNGNFEQKASALKQAYLSISLPAHFKGIYDRLHYS